MRVVYKYRGCNELGWTVLEKSALWLSAPMHFDDKKDMQKQFPHLFQSEFREMAEGLAKIKVEQGSASNHTEGLRESINNLAANSLFPSIFYGRELLDYVNVVRNESGVVCFGDSDQNPHLWKAYGDMERGFCMGFYSNAFNGWKVHQVAYGEDPNENNLRYWTAPKEKIRMALCLRKDQQWEAEREWRLIIPKKADQLLPFASTAIACVSLGSAMKSEDQKRLIQLVESKYPLAELRGVNV